jgi:hypothetical protein
MDADRPVCGARAASLDAWLAKEHLIAFVAIAFISILARRLVAEELSA